MTPSIALLRVYPIKIMIGSLQSTVTLLGFDDFSLIQESHSEMAELT
jgi:hypothetical protein